MFSVRFYSRLSPRQLGIGSFILSATGMFLLAFSVSNDWGTPAVIAGLMIAGVGEGVLLTLLFNVLVSSSPKELAGDVGALRGVVNNVSSALGAAFAGVVLSGFNQAGLPETLRNEINFDEVNFVSNSQLKEFLGTTSATEEQVDVAVRINEDARLRALRASFLLLALISLLAIVPAVKLPNYRPGELSSQAIIDEEGRRKKKPSKSQGSKQ